MAKEFKKIIPTEAIEKALLVKHSQDAAAIKQDEIEGLRSVISDFWDFLIENNLVNEFKEWCMDNGKLTPEEEEDFAIHQLTVIATTKEEVK